MIYMSNETTTKFRVQFVNNRLGHGAIVVVEAATREQAAVEAIKKVIRGAKEYNAKYTAGPVKLPNWALRDDKAENYTVTAVRKAPTRKAA